MRAFYTHLIIATFSALLVYICNDSLKPEFTGIAYYATIAMLLELAFWLYDNRQILGLHFKTRIVNRNRPLRISMAYLYKIECNGKYLLVKNTRFSTTKYQPVGGVYKYYNPESKEFLENLSAKVDDMIENDDQSEHDLRLQMKCQKNLIQVLRWFKTGQGRETSPWREFQEELIATEILDPNVFPYVHTSLRASHIEYGYDLHDQKDSFKYADIYSVRLNADQMDNLKSTHALSDERFIWVKADEIDKGVTEDGKIITPHTKKIFEVKKVKL